MTTKGNLANHKTPFYSNAGKYHGTGMVTKVGKKKGSFDDTPSKKGSRSTSIPPRMMN